jgi:catechol 2,3-dioxygenase-like lactoylglutathione lyase family enzyme
MTLHALDHVNIRTANLAAMTEWYQEILGLRLGPRPDFAFPGSWLYLGDTAIVHLVGVENGPRGEDLRLEHFAISASGLAEFVAHLDARGVAHTVDPVPGAPVVQVNLADCDGNHIHVDFPASELVELDAGTRAV